jgi:hypothetical protein
MKDVLNLSDRLHQQVRNFAQTLTRTLKKPQQKFVQQMLYGILATKDVKLSSIVRAFEEGIRPIKTENRLSRQNQNPRLSSALQQQLIEESKTWIKDDTVLAIDISDVTKPYAKKMEFLAWIRDGSDQGVLKHGYWLVGVVGAEVKGQRLLPLLMKLYSQEADDFQSENCEILSAVKAVQDANPGKGIWTLDRGGDRRALLDGLFRHRGHFVIRLKGDRNLRLGDGRLRLARSIADRVKCTERREITVEDQGAREQFHIQLGVVGMKLPWRPEPLHLIVVKGFGATPMILLTDVPVKHAGEILEIYLTRWKIEESYRFLKTSYQLEDMRVRHYAGLRNTTTLLLAVFYFLAVVLGLRFQMQLLVNKILLKAQRFFQVAGFKFYALADGIYWILVRGGRGPPISRKPESTSQLLFSFCR